MNDKRKFPRVADGVTIAVRSLPEADEPATPFSEFSVTKDISEKGLRFSPASEFMPNSLIEIRMALRDPLRAIRQVGRVRWLRQLGYGQGCNIGVELVDATETDRQTWMHYVRSQAGETAN